MSPLWTLFTILTLVALLTAPGVEDARSCGRDQVPTITATTASTRSAPLFEGDEFLISSYRDDITIFCSSSDASDLRIKDDEHQLHAENLNFTTIQVAFIKPDVGIYRYHCTDSNTSCTDTLLVQVKPAMSVTAQPFLHIPDKYAIDPSYAVPRGEAYNVFCSAQPISNLTIRRYDDDLSVPNEKLRTKPVNETTVMITVTNDTKGGLYTCESSWFTASIYMKTEYYPEAQDFQCVVYFGTKKPKVDCSWKSLSERNVFNLSVLHDHKSTLICLDGPGSTTGGCGSVLHEELFQIFFTQDFSLLLLQTCNIKYTSFCSNQTFSINMVSITKLDPVFDLKVINTSPQGTTVAWSQRKYSACCSFRIEYRLLGTDWRSVNASTVRCQHYNGTCELQLALPCPDAHYELRVYVRYEEAIEDLYWSEPSTIFFYTAASTGGEVDPACGADFREPELPLSVDSVLHEVRELISDERMEARALKKRISDMYRKVAEIKALTNAQK